MLRSLQAALCIALAIGIFATAAAEQSDPRLDPITGSQVYLSVGTFEPTRSDVAIPDEWRGEPQEDYDYFLVLLEAPATREKRDVLRGLGADLLEYYHYNTYLVRIDVPATAALSTTDAVAWHGLWHPWFKVSPDLQSETEETEIDIELHQNESPDALVRWLAERGYDAISGKSGGNQYFVRTTVPSELRHQIAKRREIHWMERHVRPVRRNVHAQWVHQSYVVNYRPLWDAGITGEGQVLEVNDSGVRTTHLAFVDESVPINDFGVYPNHRKIIAYLDMVPGGGAGFGDEYVPYPPYGHGTHVAGSVAGEDGTWSNNEGMARDAKIVVSDVGCANGTLNTMPPYWAFTETYDVAGATIHNCSWGSDSEGAYWLNDKSADQYMWEFQDRLAVMACGNNPPNFYVSTPAVAKSVISSGASRNANAGNDGDELALFTSRGPCSDGRMAPTVLTVGQNLNSCGNNNNQSYFWCEGTSMAAPVCTGNAALVRQYYMAGYYPTGSPVPANGFTPLGSLLKATLIVSGMDVAGFIPINDRTGWGIVRLDHALYLGGRGHRLWAKQDTLCEFEEKTWDFSVQAGSDLKFALVWSDRQGDTGGNQELPRLKNDLDLEVTGPGGVYHGNQFSGGESCTGGSEDRLNTSEVVWLREPTAGTYTARVTYYVSPLDDPQPFALVAIGEELCESGADLEPPTVPQNLELSPAGLLSWSASTDNIGVDGYRVYRNTMAFFNVAGMDFLGCTTGTTYSVTGSMGDPDINYYFRVTAFDAAENESGASNTVGEHDYELEDAQ